MSISMESQLSRIWIFSAKPRVLELLWTSKQTPFTCMFIFRYVEFTISEGLIHVAGRKATIGSAIEIEFAKVVPTVLIIFCYFFQGPEDNPKVNALAILTGGEAGLPHLPAPVQIDEQETNTRRRREIEDNEEDKWHQMEEIRNHPDPDAQINLDVASGPRASNPHDEKVCDTLFPDKALFRTIFSTQWYQPFWCSQFPSSTFSKTYRNSLGSFSIILVLYFYAVSFKSQTLGYTLF